MQSGGHSGVNYSLSPANFDGKGVGTSGVDVQFAAGMAGGKRRRSRRARSSRRGSMRKMGGARRRSRKSRKTRRMRR